MSAQQFRHFVQTTKTTQPRPQVSSVNGSIWLFNKDYDSSAAGHGELCVCFSPVTIGKYFEWIIKVFIESSHTWWILQTYQTVLQQFYFSTCLYHCSSIRPLYIHGLLHGTSCSTQNNNNFWSSGTSHTINCNLLIHCKSLLKECDHSIIQSALMTNSGQILRHQYGISVAESQTFLTKCPPVAISGERRLVLPAG